MHKTLVLLLSLLVVVTVQAEIQSEARRYTDGEQTLTGHFYWDDAFADQRPGVLVIHEWWGLNAYAKQRARMLAELGFVAFAADMYGDNRVTDQPDQAREWMQEVTVDPEMWRARAALGLAQLKSHRLSAAKKLAAIGYCFGGGTVLQMAYGGSEVLGVVSFHGSLPAAPEESKGKIGARLLVLHGQSDTYLPVDIVNNFQAKLSTAEANWEMVIYGGVRHGFTNPGAGEYGLDNLKYDAQADERSWNRMQDFFAELFTD